LVFGFYNFRKKALFFAGDIGSIAIGVLIFFIGFLFTIKLSSPLILLVVIVYGADTGCTFLYRKIFTNESVFDPHRHHIYQKLVDVKKMSHIKVSVVYAIIQLLINIVLYYTYQLDVQTQFLILLSVISFFILMYILLFNKLKTK
jgi:UDP-N-acetylmuramyl pentapeptide phosphotransferase/UDP-N-acetylglucosamine-1-phosphate transferase